MELNRILGELLPCDSENPYIFISYSSEDRELVWQDALEFQKRGYNIWIDEKNLDKTEDSWRYNALPAIEDMDCELVVFYVSRHSLISEGCYLELEKTIEEQTQAIHFGPVKFIAVDVEDIGNIIEFSKTVYSDLRCSDLPKEQKKKQAIILDKFKKNFFNSNNEKVRIHPKDETNRKMDYYEEITASFPDSTRTLPVQSDLPIPEDPLPAIQNLQEEPVPELSPTPEKEPSSSPELSSNQPASPKAHPSLTQEELVYQAMVASNRQSTKFTFIRIQECKSAQIATATERFARGAREETLIGFLDTSFSENGKSGFLLTSEKLYSDKLQKNGYCLDLRNLKKASFSSTRANHIDVTFEDFSCTQVYFGIYGDKILSFLSCLADLKEGRIPATPKTPAYHATRDMIRTAVAAAAKNAKGPSFFESPVSLKEEQMKNAVKTYAPSECTASILFLWDTTVRSSGKAGFLLTQGRLYYSELPAGGYIELDNLENASLDSSYISITYTDGYTRRVFFNIYSPGIYAFLQELITLERGH